MNTIWHVVEGHMPRQTAKIFLLAAALWGFARYAWKILGGSISFDIQDIVTLFCGVAFIVVFYGSEALLVASALIELIVDRFTVLAHQLSDGAHSLKVFLETDFGKSSEDQEHVASPETPIGRLLPTLAILFVGGAFSLMLFAVERSKSSMAKEMLSRPTSVGTLKVDKELWRRDFALRWNDLPYECEGCGGEAVEFDDPRLSKIRIPIPRRHPLLRNPRWYVPKVPR